MGPRLCAGSPDTVRALEILAVPASVPAPRRRLLADVSHPPTSEVLAVASAPVPAPRQRLLADVSHSPTSEVLTVASASVPQSRRPPADVYHSPTSEVLPVASAPVPAPRRRLPVDVSRSPTSVVLTAASATVPVQRGRVQADPTLVPASEVFAVPAPLPAPVRAPVPVQRRRVPADATLVPASENLAVPAPVLAPRPWLRSELLPSAPVRSSGHPPEELQCLAPDRPSELQNSVPEQPRSRRAGALDTSRRPSSDSPLLPPVSVHVWTVWDPVLEGGDCDVLSPVRSFLVLRAPCGQCYLVISREPSHTKDEDEAVDSKTLQADTKQIPIIPGLSSGLGTMMYAGSIGTQIANELINTYRMNSSPSSGASSPFGSAQEKCPLVSPQTSRSASSREDTAGSLSLSQSDSRTAAGTGSATSESTGVVPARLGYHGGAGPEQL
ncbi:unnamed protein product [Pleuronectes platessa]|uniref:Uncharacterized protein n=1 Tax=Pleuronectes platessa TaxID=8262 RepID=A0A9N7V5C3_PLEPL|nr:unnamed protein product [Pleuronectes platessa]